MGKKDSGKKTILPALGKPKPKPKKTSMLSVGKRANEEFKKGYADKDKRSIPILTGASKFTAKEEASFLAKQIKKGFSESINESTLSKYKNKLETRKRKIARITGV